MHADIGQKVTRYEMCSLASKANLTSLTSSNLLSSFKRTGIHQFNPQAFDKSVIKPSEVLQELTTESEPIILKPNKTALSMSDDNPENHTVVHTLAEGDLVVHQKHENDNPSQDINTFFTKRVSKVTTKPSKPRKTLFKITSGKAVTEDETFNLIYEHVQQKQL